MAYKNPEMRRAKQAEYNKNNKERMSEWQKQYNEDNKERISEYNKAYALAHKETKRANDKRTHALRRQSNREKLLTLLGHKCVRCGFTDVRALQVDHINGGGNQERKACKSLDEYYQKIIECGGIGYQILCANCNQIKRHEKQEFAGIKK